MSRIINGKMDRSIVILNLSKLDLKCIKYALGLVDEKIKYREITISYEEIESLQHTIEEINKSLGYIRHDVQCRNDDKDSIPY